MAKKTIKTFIQIAASPAQVWAVLSDFDAYPNWNPFIKSVKGDFAVGKQVEIQVDNMTFKPKVLAFAPNKEIRWMGQLFIDGIFNGEHCFEIVDNHDGTSTLKHEEYFSGILVGLLAKKLDAETKAGFEAMNKKLKTMVEASVE